MLFDVLKCDLADTFLTCYPISAVTVGFLAASLDAGGRVPRRWPRVRRR
jgi:hypothetical protein